MVCSWFVQCSDKCNIKIYGSDRFLFYWRLVIFLFGNIYEICCQFNFFVINIGNELLNCKFKGKVIDYGKGKKKEDIFVYSLKLEFFYILIILFNYVNLNWVGEVYFL